MAVMGSPALSACMFLGGSGILDKAVSCLRPWREVITGPTSTGLTGRLGGSCEVSAATASPRLRRAIPPHILPACQSTVFSLGPVPNSILIGGLFCMLIYMLVWLASLYRVSEKEKKKSLYFDSSFLCSDVSMYTLRRHADIILPPCCRVPYTRHTKASRCHFFEVEPSSSANTDATMSLLSPKTPRRDRDREGFSAACLEVEYTVGICYH